MVHDAFESEQQYYFQHLKPCIPSSPFESISPYRTKIETLRQIFIRKTATCYIQDVSLMIFPIFRTMIQTISYFNQVGKKKKKMASELNLCAYYSLGKGGAQNVQLTSQGVKNQLPFKVQSSLILSMLSRANDLQSFLQ